MNHTQNQPAELGPTVDTLPGSGFAPTDMEERIARWQFADALGRQTLQEQPDLFDRLLVGSWESLGNFVDDFITESGLHEGIAQLPSVYSQLVTVDRLRVADYLRRYLLVLSVGDTVWVFDARPVVKTTVAKKQRWAHSEGQKGPVDDSTN